jgi:peptide/nickel transport system substrate-binding protein
MLKILVALAALFVALPAAAQKDRLVLGQVLEPPHLDPTAGTAAAIREVLYANVLEGLTRIDEKSEVRPLLAESWTVSPDGKTYTFKLKEGVTFHDGTPFSSADVKFSFERAAAPDSTNALKALIFSGIEAVETPDAATAVVRLKQPNALLLYFLGWADSSIFSPKTAADTKTKPVGTGPFKFVRWVKGDRIELERYDAYKGDKPALKTVVLRYIPDPSAAAAAVLSGDVDAFPNFPAPEALPQFRNDPRFTVKIGATEGETILAMNNGRKPFDDVRVRRAVAHAIDRKALIEGIYAGQVAATPIGSHFSPIHPAYVDLTGMYPHDVAKAKALLEEAGYAEGLSVTLKLPPPTYARRGGEILAQQLAAVGIKVSIEPVQFPQWLKNVFRNKDYDLTVISHTEPLDIDIYSRPTYYFNYKNPRFNAIIEKVKETPDEAERNKLYAEAQRILAEDCVNGFLFQLPKIGVWNKDLTGLWENSPIQANDVTKVAWRR